MDENSFQNYDLFEHLFEMLENYTDLSENQTAKFNEYLANITVPIEFQNHSELMGSAATERDPCAKEPYNYVDWTQIRMVRHAITSVYILLVVISLIGNSMVILTISRNKHMRTVTNCYILNLAICDFIISLVVVPLTLLEYLAPCRWQLFHSDALCGICKFSLPVFVFASIITLAAISIER